jgi:diaminohydroxyphosphoribosylaminopyrimidine deaminase/5-amino-6-(5-phosphoribosylamino)uracil reductase
VEAKGASVLVLPAPDGRVSLRACLSWLAKLGITSVLIEGGSEVNATALRSGLVNRLCFFLAPKLLGGQDAKGAIGGRSPKRLAQAVRITDVEIRRLGEDLLLTGSVAGRKADIRTR